MVPLICHATAMKLIRTTFGLASRTRVEIANSVPAFDTQRVVDLLTTYELNQSIANNQLNVFIINSLLIT